MITKDETRGVVKVLDGNRAAAQGVLLCRPDVVCAYPITPETPLLEALCKYCTDGTLDAQVVQVEGEVSAISVLMGAAAAGARTFTGTCSQGLAFMAESYFWVSGLRLPIVMAIATRELASPAGVSSSQQDVMFLRDAGWIQFHCETCQEILDSIIMAYRLAEDPDILLPVNVCYDGIYLSHLSERVEIPSQKDVDKFLPPWRSPTRLDPEMPMSLNVWPPEELFSEYRYKHCKAMQQTKSKFEEIDKEFGSAFGRSYGGLVDEYRNEDADIVLVTMGSSSGTARVAVDNKREQGIKVGLVKVRMFRPFPRERLAQALAGKRAVGVLDKNVCFGWAAGTLFVELKTALHGFETASPVLNFIDGLGGVDVTLEHLERAIDITWLAAQGKPHQEITWLALE